MISKTKVAILGILILAALLRFYKLGGIPPSLDWDEASIGYNAYSLLKTGKDEYGNSWPLSIRSFNDYKPPAYVYLTIPSVYIFGLNEFSVRFPSALAGTLTVLITYLLVKELFKDKEWKMGNEKWEIKPQVIAAGLLAINPWHLQFSRVAFEANIALTFFVVAVYLLLMAFNSKSIIYYLSSAAFFIATIYSYHSARVIVPLFLVITLFIYKKKIKEQIKPVSISFFLGVVLLMPLGLTLMRGYAQARFSTVSVFTNQGIFTQEQEKTERQKQYRLEDLSNNSLFYKLHQPWIVLAIIISEGYFDHFDIRYLFIEGDDIGRHSVAGMGLLYFWELPLFLIGLYFMLKEKTSANKIIFSWLLIGPSAAALATHTPHAVRSLLMLPPLVIITTFGLFQLINSLRHRTIPLVIIALVILGSLVYYLDLYYIHTPKERASDWQYGYKQLVGKVNQLENNYEEVIITTDYDQPHIFFLFHKKVDPSWYQQYAENGSRGFGKFIFRKIEYRQDEKLLNRLIVGVSKEIPDDAPVIDEIDFPNGKSAFLLVKT
jgi:4-amino-4-deoxy-L-arabinose transferase-like glycosyltransferase